VRVDLLEAMSVEAC